MIDSPLYNFWENVFHHCEMLVLVRSSPHKGHLEDSITVNFMQLATH